MVTRHLYFLDQLHLREVSVASCDPAKQNVYRTDRQNSRSAVRRILAKRVVKKRRKKPHALSLDRVHDLVWSEAQRPAIRSGLYENRRVSFQVAS
jgi:hypothetical protein